MCSVGPGNVVLKTSLVGDVLIGWLGEMLVFITAFVIEDSVVSLLVPFVVVLTSMVVISEISVFIMLVVCSGRVVLKSTDELEGLS